MIDTKKFKIKIDDNVQIQKAKPSKPMSSILEFLKPKTDFAILGPRCIDLDRSRRVG